MSQEMIQVSGRVSAIKIQEFSYEKKDYKTGASLGRVQSSTVTVTINETDYVLMFWDPRVHLPFKEGDTINFSWEDYIQKGKNNYPDRFHKKIDPKSLSVESGRMPQSALPDDNRQILIVAQNALTNAVKYHEGTNAPISAVLSTMREFANAVLNFKVAVRETQEGDKFVDDDIPF